MQVVVCVFCAVNTPHYETALEIAERHLRKGDEVTMLGCNGDLLSCNVNKKHDPVRCAECIGRRRAGLDLLSRPIESRSVIQLYGEDIDELRNLTVPLSDLEELQDWAIENYEIGYGVLSSLISRLRDPTPDLDKYADTVRSIAMSALAVFRSVQNYLEANDVDRVYAYNGRHAPVRAVLRACQSRQVDCFLHERGHSLDHYAVYQNHLPHNLSCMEQRIRQQWALAADDLDRESRASEFFIQRANGVVQWWRSFIDGQEEDLLPEDWDPGRRNIAIFTSSQDEFAAIGAEWQNPLYENQLEGIRRIVESLSTASHDIHLYVRMHPNLTNVGNAHTRAIRQLQADDLTIILPEDPVSSYSLLREAEKVLTFGSTMGIEAVFWGKPSLLAGVSFYRDLGGTYNPASHQELMDLLIADVPVRDKKAALMYGYYMGTFGTAFEFFEAEGIKAGTFKGQCITAPEWIQRARRAYDGSGFVRRVGRKAFEALTRWKLTRSL